MGARSQPNCYHKDHVASEITPKLDTVFCQDSAVPNLSSSAEFRFNLAPTSFGIWIPEFGFANPPTPEAISLPRIVVWGVGGSKVGLLGDGWVAGEVGGFRI